MILSRRRAPVAVVHRSPITGHRSLAPPCRPCPLPYDSFLLEKRKWRSQVLVRPRLAISGFVFLAGRTPPLASGSPQRRRERGGRRRASGHVHPLLLESAYLQKIFSSERKSLRDGDFRKPREFFLQVDPLICPRAHRRDAERAERGAEAIGHLLLLLESELLDEK